MSKPGSKQHYRPCKDEFTFTISGDIYEAYNNISEDRIMSLIIHSKPDGVVSVFDIKKRSFASWKKRVVIPDFLMGVDWQDKMGRVRDQKNHETCWAIVASELISALRYIRRDDAIYTEYSSQFLVDYACPEKTNFNHGEKKHYCYRHTIFKALQFVRDAGIPQERHWEYKGCRLASPPTYTPPAAEDPHVFIASGKLLSTIDKALEKLQFHPIGAALTLFSPDYHMTKGGIYRGPLYRESEYKGLHAVCIYRVGKENGEAIAYVKSTHGELIGERGYFKVSLEVEMVEVPRMGEIASIDDFEKPRRLLSRFCYPELLPREV